jgi:hypothetical protein
MISENAVIDVKWNRPIFSKKAASSSRVVLQIRESSSESPLNQFVTTDPILAPFHRSSLTIGAIFGVYIDRADARKTG